MKPERGSSVADDMEECDTRDPRELLQELGLLVLEARTPDPSAKGRTDGPHCPLSRRPETHVCNDDTLECVRAYDLGKQLDMLWKNNIPVCMDVLLYPDCIHGQREAQVLEAGGQSVSGSEAEDCVLLERWTFKFCLKRHMDKSGCRCVGSAMLLQAIKSYLHFSQLSSWLMSSSGCLPLTIVYRVYAPGEEVVREFVESPDQHSFPQADLLQYGVKVQVSTLSRRDVVHLKCTEGHDGASASTDKRAAAKEFKDKEQSLICKSDLDSKQERGRSLKRTRFHQSEISRKRENRRLPVQSDVVKPSTSNISPDQNHEPDFLSSCSSLCDRTNLGRKSDVRGQSFVNKSAAISLENANSVEEEDSSFRGILPEQSDFRESYPQKFRLGSPSRQIFKEKLLPLKPEMYDTNLQVSLPTSMSKCLHSPKVLMTSNTKLDQVFTKKKYLDLSTSSESDEYDNQCMAMHIKDLASPLSPSDIQAYLSSLQTVAYGHSPSEQGKCKFYLGQDGEKFVDNGYQSAERKSEFVNVTKRLFSHENTEKYSVFKHDLDSVTKKLHELSPFNHSESPPTKKEKKELRTNVESSQDACVSGPVSPNKTCKRKHVRDVSDVGAKCSNLEDSGLDSGDTSISNGHQSYTGDEEQNGAVPSPEVENERYARSPEGSPVRVSQSEDTLCKSCDILVDKRLSNLRKNPSTPTFEETNSFRRNMTKSASMMFNSRTGLPTQSSPAPIKRKSLGRFEYDSSLTSTRAIKNALSCSKLVLGSSSEDEQQTDNMRQLSTSAPASTNCLLGNFEESMLNGRIEPIGAVDGFMAEIGASGAFCPKHVTLPVTSYFFQLSDDNAPSPYLGHIDLEGVGKKGYHIPKRGTVQVTLFNPNKTVVKMFVVMYDLSDMPPNCQTFLRQRTLYMPVDPSSDEPSFLRYLIHLRFASSRSGKIYLHTDIRLIFARDKFEFDNKVAQYELRSFNEGPQNPKFSPKR